MFVHPMVFCSTVADFNSDSIRCLPHVVLLLSFFKTIRLFHQTESSWLFQLLLDTFWCVSFFPNSNTMSSKGFLAFVHGHVRTWLGFLFSSLNRGHLELSHSFLQSICLPVALYPLMYLVSHCCLCSGRDFPAHLIAPQFIKWYVWWVVFPFLSYVLSFVLGDVLYIFFLWVFCAHNFHWCLLFIVSRIYFLQVWCLCPIYNVDSPLHLSQHHNSVFPTLLVFRWGLLYLGAILLVEFWSRWESLFVVHRLTRLSQNVRYLC